MKLGHQGASPPLRRLAPLLTLLSVLALGSTDVMAQELPGIVSEPTAEGGQRWSIQLQTLLLLSGMAFLPAILLMMTCFTRIIIVLSLLRTAMGIQSAPPNQVLLGLTLFLTFFIMAPVFNEVYQVAWQPLSNDEIGFQQFLVNASEPMRAFMMAQTREPDLALFARLGDVGPMQGPEDVPFQILVPAFVTSELKTAFQIGFMIFIPFLIIDLVVASILMALGMMMVPPATISMPFKLMLFVLVDGWQLIIGSLAESFFI